MARRVDVLLQKYCAASVHCINKDKSSVFFSKGCSESLRQEIMQVLDVQNEKLSEKYLGLPSDMG